MIGQKEHSSTNVGTYYLSSTHTFGLQKTQLLIFLRSSFFSGHMFNTGLPPLDRQGLFPSHGSILDPLHQTATFSNKRSSSSSSMGLTAAASSTTSMPPSAPSIPIPKPTNSFRPKENPKAVEPPTPLPPTVVAAPSAHAAIPHAVPRPQHHAPPAAVPPQQPPPTVNLTNDDSDEEVLVDDFDGQCCRTYPDNHSRIIKWRAQRAEKLRQQKQKNQEQGTTAATAPPAPHPPPVSKSAPVPPLAPPMVSPLPKASQSVKPMTSSLVPRKSQDGGKTTSGPSSSGKNAISLLCTKLYLGVINQNS